MFYLILICFSIQHAIILLHHLWHPFCTEGGQLEAVIGWHWLTSSGAGSLARYQLTALMAPTPGSLRKLRRITSSVWQGEAQALSYWLHCFWVEIWKSTSPGIPMSRSSPYPAWSTLPLSTPHSSTFHLLSGYTYHIEVRVGFFKTLTWTTSHPAMSLTEVKIKSKLPPWPPPFSPP